MKTTVTGSLGHISKEIVTNLLQAGNIKKRLQTIM